MTLAAHIAIWIAADADAELVEAGPTPASARRAAAALQIPAERALADAPEPAVVEAQVAAWSAALPVVRLELHGDPIAARAVLSHLAGELPSLFSMPRVRAALEAEAPPPA